MARLGRLSNDELAGEEDTVMTVMNSLGDLMSAMDAKFNVRNDFVRPPAAGWYVSCSYNSVDQSTPVARSLVDINSCSLAVVLIFVSIGTVGLLDSLGGPFGVGTD